MAWHDMVQVFPSAGYERVRLNNEFIHTFTYNCVYKMTFESTRLFQKHLNH